MKILIIRFSSIGDIVLTSPVIRYCKEILNAEVYFLVKPQFHFVVKDNPNIDQIIKLDKDLKNTLIQIKKEKFDLILDLQNNLKSTYLKYFSWTKYKTVDKRNISKWFLVNFKSKNIEIPHIVERYLDTIWIDKSDYNPYLEFFFPTQNNLLKKFNLPKKYIAISLGAKHFTKKIPQEIIIKIIEGLDFNFILIGGNDVDFDKIMQIPEAERKISNLCGILDLSQSAQIIESSQLLITSDTGMMHIGAALGKKIHVLWGNTVPQFGMYPYYGKNVNISINHEVMLPCRPCSKIGYDKCPKEHFNCMINQNISDILYQLKRDLELI